MQACAFICWVILLSGLLRGSFCSRFVEGLRFSNIADASQPSRSWPALEGPCTRRESLLSQHSAPQTQTFSRSCSRQHMSTSLRLLEILTRSLGCCLLQQRSAV